MIAELRKAVDDGHLELSDPDLIAEVRAYTRDDLMDNEVDPRLATRHFDLLIGAAIAWQMRNYAEAPTEEYQQKPYEPSSEFEQPEPEKTKPIVNMKVFEQTFEQPEYEPMSEYEE